MPADADDDDEQEQAGSSGGGMSDGMPRMRQRPHTTEGFDALKKTKAKKQHEEKELRRTLTEEKELRSKVVKLRAELLRSRSVTAMHRSAMSALIASDKEKDMMKSRKGLDHLKKGGAKELQKAKPASDAELTKLSAAVKKAHEARFGALHPSLRNWYGLFKKYDDNFDHCITFPELQAMLRDELRMPTAKVSDKALMSAWRALDDKDSGLLDAGAFGRFYRKADVSQSRKDFNAVAEKYYKGGFVVRPVVSSYTGFLARARDQHYKSRAVIEGGALTPLEEARIEARKDVQRWAEESKLLEQELKKVTKEEKKLARTLSKRGALRSAYSGPPSSLAEARSASRSMVVQDDDGDAGGGEDDD